MLKHRRTEVLQDGAWIQIDDSRNKKVARVMLEGADLYDLATGRMVDDRTTTPPVTAIPVLYYVGGVTLAQLGVTAEDLDRTLWSLVAQLVEGLWVTNGWIVPAAAP
jgi:hypothetical protein